MSPLSRVKCFEVFFLMCQLMMSDPVWLNFSSLRGVFEGGREGWYHEKPQTVKGKKEGRKYLYILAERSVFKLDVKYSRNL